MCWLKSEVARHLVLEIFDLRTKELDDPSALKADHMVMMFVIVMVLVVCSVVPESHLAGKTSLCQQFQRAINGRQSDRRIELVDYRVKVLARQMFLRAKEGLEDQITLTGPPKPSLFDMGLED